MVRDAIKALWARYCHADAMMMAALFALIGIAWRESNVDLHSFGESVAWIFGGRGVHSAADGWGKGQQQ